MIFRHIGFDMIVYTLTEIFYSDFQQIRIITVFNAVSVSQFPVPVRLFRFSNPNPCSMFSLLFILLVIVNNEGNKLFLMCKSIPNKGSISK